MDIPAPWMRPPPDRRLVAAAFLAAACSGACFGALTLDIPPEIGEGLSVPLALGACLHGLVSLFAFGYSRVTPGWLGLLLVTAFIAGSAPRVVVERSCNAGDARACYAAYRWSDGIDLDQHACEVGNVEGACNRLLTRDASNAYTHCERWTNACTADDTDSLCKVAARRCGLILD